MKKTYLQEGRHLSLTSPSVPLVTSGHNGPSLPAKSSLLNLLVCSYCLTGPWGAWVPSHHVSQAAGKIMFQKPAYSCSSRGRGKGIQSSRWLHNELWATLSCMRPCFKISMAVELERRLSSEGYLLFLQRINNSRSRRIQYLFLASVGAHTLMAYDNTDMHIYTFLLGNQIQNEKPVSPAHSLWASYIAWLHSDFECPCRLHLWSQFGPTTSKEMESLLGVVQASTLDTVTLNIEGP